MVSRCKEWMAEPINRRRHWAALQYGLRRAQAGGSTNVQDHWKLPEATRRLFTYPVVWVL